MVKRITLLFIAAVLCAYLPFVRFQNFENEAEEEQGHFAKFFSFWQKLRVDPTTGQLDQNEYYRVAKAVEQSSQQKSLKSMGLSWTDLGPHNVGGRTRAILIDQQNIQHMFAGGVSGGLFESFNAGKSWTAWNIDSLSNLSISCLAQGANGDIYFGTGEAVAAYPGYEFPGAGLFKSSDHGKTFQQVICTKPSANSQSAVFAYINAIACDPTDANKVYLATNNGLYVSDNATQNPAVAGTGFGASNGIYFGKRATMNGSGTCWDVQCGKDGSVVAAQVGALTSIMLSTDGGNSFVAHSIANGKSFQQIRIAISPADPNYIYVATLAAGVSGGVYRSTDQGSTFSAIAAPANGSNGFNPYGNQGYYDMCIAAALNNKNKIYIGGMGDIYTWESGNLGWMRIGSGYTVGYTSKYYLHPDHHVIVPHPTNPDVMYIGNDGGIYQASNLQKNDVTFQDRNKGYSPTQFYGIGASPYGQVIGGAQDNGTNVNDFKGIYNTYWKGVIGGDGFQCAWSKINPKMVFGSLYGDASGGMTEVYRSLNGAQTFTNSLSDAHISGESGYFLTRISLQERFLPTPKSYLFYASTTNVWLCKDPAATIPTWYKINSIGIANAYRMIATPDLNTVFVGTEDGRLYRISGIDTAQYPNFNYTTFNANNVGIKTTLIYSASSRFITGISINPRNADSIVISLSNYGQANHIIRINNALSTTSAATTNTTSLQGNLPAFPIYDILLNPYNPANCIVGTEYGIWASNDIDNPTPQWQEENKNFPRVPTMQLLAVPDTNGQYYLYAGTHGRGAFYSNSLCGSCPKIDMGSNTGTTTTIIPESIQLFPNPTYDNITIKTASVGTLRVYNLKGELLFENLNKETHQVINCQEWPAGLYLVQFTDKTNHTFTSKFIKQ